MRKVTGIGETVYDIVFRDGQPQAGVPGGSTFNTMISAGRCGADSCFLSEVGSDRIGSLIKDLDIPSYMLPIPTNQYGVTDTDLSDYRNDIYKRTYRHYLVRETDLNLAEINYLLGLKAPDVDYRNYVDCSRANYRKQIRLAAAQESIASLFQGDS